MADDAQPQLLSLSAFAMVFARERLEALGQTDEADGQRALTDHVGQFVFIAQIVGAAPDALSHQEGEVLLALVRLDLHPLQELIDDEVDLRVEIG